MAMLSPVRRLRPVRANCDRVEKAPKPAIVIASPRQAHRRWPRTRPSRRRRRPIWPAKSWPLRGRRVRFWSSALPRERRPNGASRRARTSACLLRGRRATEAARSPSGHGPGHAAIRLARAERVQRRSGPGMGRRRRPARACGSRPGARCAPSRARADNQAGMDSDERGRYSTRADRPTMSSIRTSLSVPAASVRCKSSPGANEWGSRLASLTAMLVVYM